MTTIEQRTNPYAKMFLLSSLVLTTIIGITYQTHWLVAFRVIAAYVTPAILIAGIVMVVALYREGNSPLPPWPLIVGIVSLIGGASLDMIATVIKTPSLANEANPIVRSLLGSGHSIEFVYVYSLIAQILMMVLGGVLWAAFLRHRKAIIVSSRNTAPKSYWEFLKAATGGAHLSWRQYFLPLKLSELPKSYYLVWLAPVGWVGVSINRWYYGLEWLNLVHGFRNSVLVVSLLSPFFVYMLWLWVEYSRSAEPQREGEMAA